MPDIDTSEAAVDSSAVEGLLAVLVKGLRAAQLYLPNNPVYKTAMGNVVDAFRVVWDEWDQVDLEIHETQLVWDDAVVYDESDRSESLAWLLHKDGLRSVTLRAGVEQDEVVRLIGVLNTARALASDAEDDLLTLLWEEDFQYVQYFAVELGEGEADIGDRPVKPPPTAERVCETRDEDLTNPDPQTVVDLEDFDASLYMLDDHELEYLQRELEREYRQDLRANVLTILFDIFETQPVGDVRDEVIRVVGGLFPLFLEEDDPRSVSYMLREIGVMAVRSEQLTGVHKVALDDLPGALSEPATFKRLLECLERADPAPTDEELGTFFSVLRPKALHVAIASLHTLKNPQVRSLLDAAVQRLAQANPKVLGAVLASDDVDTLLSAVRLVKWLRIPSLETPLAELLEHPDAAVRKEVVSAFGEIGSGKATQRLEDVLSDASREVRIAAVRVLGNRRRQSASHRVETLLQGKHLRAADLTEKIAFFEAYGLIAGASGVAFLTKTLHSRGFMRREDPETRACAAMALGKIGTPGAKSALEAVREDREPIVRNAVRKALRGLA